MKGFYSILVFLAFSGLMTNAFCQETPYSPAQLESLYEQRLSLANEGLDYSQIELDILRSGVYPSVLVVKEIESGGVRYTFNIYSPVSGSGNQESMENRFQSMFPEIQFIEIRENKVNVLMSEITHEQLDLFFYYLGYKTIQLKN